ncbi:MAG: hypothetical protein LBT49_05205, partial [Prevotellaceae bacterium]|nr:hypothetical protein [Prevotellaceae bacterium]
MRKYYYVICKAGLTIAALLAGFTLSAEPPTPVHKTDYFSGNEEPAAALCMELVNTVVQSKLSCVDGNDATLDVTFFP